MNSFGQVWLAIFHIGALFLTFYINYKPHSIITPFFIDGNICSPLVIMLFFFLSPFNINGKGNYPYAISLPILLLCLECFLTYHHFSLMNWLLSSPSINMLVTMLLISSILYLSPLLIYLMVCDWRCLFLHILPLSKILLCVNFKIFHGHSFTLIIIYNYKKSSSSFTSLFVPLCLLIKLCYDNLYFIICIIASGCFSSW